MLNIKTLGPKRTPRKMWAPNGARAGFTLIELMVVLLLISLMTGLIVPSAVSALRRNGANSEGEKLLEMLQFAHLSAITRHHAVVVNIDGRRGLCWVSLSRTTLPWLENQVESGTQTLATLQLPDTVQIFVSRGERTEYTMGASQGWERFTFRGNGGADNITIELTDSRDEKYTLGIIGATGEIVVRKR